jgi:hypothetical protein
MKYTIKNNLCVKIDTLYSGFAYDNPVISMDGRYIAFCRNGSVANNKNECKGKYGNGTSHCGWISIIDSGGTNLQDLLFISSEINIDQVLLDWPAGNWIYYRHGSDKEIWKFDIHDPDNTNQKVVTYDAGMRKWSISADGQHAALQDGMCNFPHAFTGGRSVISLPQTCVGGCNIHIAPGGRYYCYFTDSGHGAIRIGLWNGTEGTKGEAIMTYRVDSIWAATDALTWASAWLPADRTLSGGMDWPNWSCNSDKWVCLKVGWPKYDESWSGLAGRFCKCGTNQVLANWVDTIAVSTSRNAGYSSGDPEKMTECAGDFWVLPPEEFRGKQAYETVDGNWVVAGAATGMLPIPGHKKHAHDSRVVINNNNARITMPSDEFTNVIIVNGRGRTVFVARELSGEAVLIPQLRSGAYFARIIGNSHMQNIPFIVY